MPRNLSGGDAALLADAASAAFDASRRFVDQIGFGATFAPDAAVRLTGQPLGFDLSPVDDATIGSLLPAASAHRWRDHVERASWVETVGFTEHTGVGRLLAEHLERLFGLPASVEVVVARSGANRQLAADGPQVVAQLAGSAMLIVDGREHPLQPGQAASLAVGTPAHWQAESPWGTALVAHGAADESNLDADAQAWQASVDLRRDAPESFHPVRRAMWRPGQAPVRHRPTLDDPAQVRCCAPGGAVVCESTETSLVVAIGRRVVVVPRRWVYPFVVALSGAAVSLSHLLALFEGDQSAAAQFVEVGRSAGWLEVVANAEA